MSAPLTMTAAPSTSATRDAAAAWPTATSRPLGCLPMREAVRRARNSEHYVGSRRRRAMYSWLYRAARQWAETGRQPVPTTFDGELWVPVAMHAALAEPARQPGDAPNLQALPSGRRNRALTKDRALAVFNSWWRLGAGRALGLVAARAAFAREHQGQFTYRDGEREVALPLSAASLARWSKQREQGGLDALAIDGRGRYGRRQPSPEAIELYWSLRNDPRCFRLASCWRQVRLAARRKGWAWFESLSSCRAWDRRARDERGLVLNQRGELRFTAKAGPYLEADPESFEPGECWELDHSTLNVWCRRGEQVFRPVLTLALDWRSRAVTGFRIVASGNQESILLALGDGARRYWLPSFVTVDNGRDFKSYLFAGGKLKRWSARRSPAETRERFDGVFARLGIEPRYTLPYSPNSKARVERVFRTLDELACKPEPSYCGSTPDQRPAAHADLAAKAVEYDAFCRRFAQAVEVYNQTPHSGEGMDGRTPAQVLALATRRRVLSDDQATYLLAAWPRPVKVGRQGVAIRLAGYTVRYGAFDPAVQALPLGTKVSVSYDPDDLATVLVWHVDGRFIGRITENHRYNRRFGSEELRAALREKRRGMKRLRAAARDGLRHLGSDPVAHAVAAAADDAARRRKPDPPAPPGSPLLMPIQTPFEAPPKQVAALRRAVGAPDAALDPLAEIRERMAEFARRSADDRERAAASRGDGRAELLAKLAEATR